MKNYMKVGKDILVAHKLSFVCVCPECESARRAYPRATFGKLVQAETLVIGEEQGS